MRYTLLPQKVFTLLIVLNGIEMQHAEEHRRGRLLLIVLNGIEIEPVDTCYIVPGLLIVLNGIEMTLPPLSGSSRRSLLIVLNGIEINSSQP